MIDIRFRQSFKDARMLQHMGKFVVEEALEVGL
jgi:hypothetical protein